MKQIRLNFWTQLLVVYTRMMLGGGFVFASIIKIKGKRFTTVSHEDAPFGTAMHFFETMYQTGIYWQFLGWGQLIAGFLLMTQRYAKLGAVINFPIILNVFIITISMDFNYTPGITGMMLLANIGLLLWHWDELKILVNLPPTSTAKNQLVNEPIWEITGLILFSFTAIYRLLYDRYDPVFWFLVCLAIGLAALPIRQFSTKIPRQKII
ncbi:hypothetical protein [Shivajiella indica]|uniref:DoxX family protein n=1 Tax=Shivajiella indica TaxID=872115 RepID=A0ABW5B7E4_9BACT